MHKLEINVKGDLYMKKRSPIFVFLIGFITIFIYSWYWLVKTKGEMNKLGQKIPTAWIWLIPIAGSIWWLWKYSEAVESVTNKEVNKVLAFVVMYLLGPIGHAIVQDFFNKVEPAVATTVSTTGLNPVPQTQVTPAVVPVSAVSQDEQSPTVPPSNTPAV
jgi:hypothetical protein